MKLVQKNVDSGSRDLEICSSYVQSHANVFLSIAFQKRLFYFETRFDYVKKYKLSITVFTTIYWVKPARPAEPILLTSTLLMGALTGDAG